MTSVQTQKFPAEQSRLQIRTFYPSKKEGNSFCIDSSQYLLDDGFTESISGCRSAWLEPGGLSVSFANSHRFIEWNVI